MDPERYRQLGALLAELTASGPVDDQLRQAVVVIMNELVRRLTEQ